MDGPPARGAASGDEPDDGPTARRRAWSGPTAVGPLARVESSDRRRTATDAVDETHRCRPRRRGVGVLTQPSRRTTPPWRHLGAVLAPLAATAGAVALPAVARPDPARSAAARQGVACTRLGRRLADSTTSAGHPRPAPRRGRTHRGRAPRRSAVPGAARASPPCAPDGRSSGPPRPPPGNVDREQLAVGRPRRSRTSVVGATPRRRRSRSGAARRRACRAGRRDRLGVARRSHARVWLRRRSDRRARVLARVVHRLATVSVGPAAALGPDGDAGSGARSRR